MKKRIIVVLTVFAVWQLYMQRGEVQLGPGILAPDDPVQVFIENPLPFPHGEFSITPLAEFHIKAKILSAENYYLGREARLSPVDLALGWGVMSDESLLSDVEISQGGRWYIWRSNNRTVERSEISDHSANMHMIPSNKGVNQAMDKARQGDIIEIRGYLVQADMEDGWRWSSSLSRTDRGNHACELVWVNEFINHTL